MSTRGSYCIFSGILGRVATHGSAVLTTKRRAQALPLDKRLDDLIGRLTLDEKPFLLIARESPLGNISRLGIPEYDWGGNCIHGVQSRCGCRAGLGFCGSTSVSVGSQSGQHAVVSGAYP